ncbi:hypothetical protein ACFQH6_05965 [Halobacteriaceae archaeon GCM10025711]
MTERDPLRTVALVAGVAAVVSLLVALGVSAPVGPRRGMMGMGSMDLFLQVKVFLATFNLLVLLALTGTYLSLYRELPNQFTLSLLLFSAALMLYALASNPLLHLLFGFRGGVTLGPFTFLPDAFAAVAVLVLLYQSNR